MSRVNGPRLIYKDRNRRNQTVIVRILSLIGTECHPASTRVQTTTLVVVFFVVNKFMETPLVLRRLQLEAIAFEGLKIDAADDESVF